MKKKKWQAKNVAYGFEWFVSVAVTQVFYSHANATDFEANRIRHWN